MVDDFPRSRNIRGTQTEFSTYETIPTAALPHTADNLGCVCVIEI